MEMSKFALRNLGLSSFHHLYRVIHRAIDQLRSLIFPTTIIVHRSDKSFFPDSEAVSVFQVPNDTLSIRQYMHFFHVALSRPYIVWSRVHWEKGRNISFAEGNSSLTQQTVSENFCYLWQQSCKNFGGISCWFFTWQHLAIFPCTCLMNFFHSIWPRCLASTTESRRNQQF